uniref:Uncharacterized protein n=1 Tax=Arundo donax TaxID=35708 RepID=A0A0A9AST7_ARUDO
MILNSTKWMLKPLFLMGIWRRKYVCNSRKFLEKKEKRTWFAN